MKFVVLSAGVALALPAPALAADWVFLVENLSDVKYYIDRQSMRLMPNGYKRAWIRSDYAKADKFGNTSSKFLDEYDCNQGRQRMLTSIYYKGEEVTVSGNTVGLTAEWQYPSPDSIGETLFNFVCRK